MATKTRGVRVPEDLEVEIAREAEERGKTWSATAKELLTEAVRMRRAPGIVFVDGPSGRRAVVAGPGIDAWEVIATWKQGDEDYDELRKNYDWLNETQIRAALSYYEQFPSEIDTRLAREREWTSERLRKELPFTVSLKSRRA